MRRPGWAGASRRGGARRRIHSLTLLPRCSQYYVQITAGTPAQYMNVILDTGSADLVLATSPCTGCETTTTLYSANRSTTSSELGTSFSITYGTGSASGTLVTDLVSIGGLNVSGTTIAACTTVDDLLTESYESGLLGMGWKALATSGATPLLEQLYNSGALDEPVFGMAFAGWADDSLAYDAAEHGGMLSIGGVNPYLYSGSISYISLTGTTYWSIPLEDITINGVSLGISFDSCIIDSGTTLISIPAADVATVYAKITGSTASGSLMLYPSSANVSLSMQFGGITYNVSDFSFGQASATQNYGIIYDASAGTSTSQCIIGDAFLKSVYSVFSFDPPAVGFATLDNTNNELEDGTEPTAVASAGVAQATVASGATATGSAGVIVGGPVTVGGAGVSRTSSRGASSTGETKSGASSTSGCSPVGQGLGVGAVLALVAAAAGAHLV